MGEAALASLLRRERSIALAAMLAIAALAWIWVVREAARMGGMVMLDMDGMRMSYMQMMSPQLAPWSLTLASYLFCMWFVMMIGMMTPSVAPMVLLYLGVARHAAGSGQRFASSGWFFGGYLLAWAAFALLATGAQWWLESRELMTPTMQAASRPLGAAVLIAAGIHQWLPLKDQCLAKCRAPLAFIQQHGGFQASAAGSLRLGLVHGFYCVGCCWALMLLLFVFGVMNLLWIAGLALFVLLEKLAPGAKWIGRIAGLAALGTGITMLLR
jgi:predicted metal-binding membrane protein